MKFNLNMVLAALLGTVFVLMTVSFISEAIFDPHHPEKEGFVIEVAETTGGAPAEVQETPIAVLLASASADAGERVFKRCQACHDVTEGGPNKVGPNLWDVVDRPIASHEGFSYSAAMQEFSEGGSKHWTYENLDAFIKAPKKDIPGTAMGFAGLAADKDRADLIAYLSTLSNNPVPFPEPPAEGASDEAAAPADGASETAAPAEGAAEEAQPADANMEPKEATAEPAEGAEPTPPGAAESEQPAKTE